MDPKHLREYLRERGCSQHRYSHATGIEVWRKPGLKKPIQFYVIGRLHPHELDRIVEALGTTSTDLGDWRKKRGV